jgi:ubiquitin carboxyl-terminal hydrolase 4/11/15
MVQDITDNNSVSGEEPLPILSPLPQNGESSNDSEQHAGFGKEALSLSSVTSTSSVPADDKESQILTERRQEIVDLLKTSYGAEGDLLYIISHVFLKTFLYLQVDSWSQLANELGPLDMNLIVDPMGNLYHEKDEPVPTYNVPPQVFIKLTEWFEVKGDPVVRTLVKNPETGSIEV